jgi:RHS repeat-associated protein
MMREMRLLWGVVCALTMTIVAHDLSFSKTDGSGDPSSAVNSKGYDRNTAYLTIDGPAINAFNLNFMVQFPLAVGLSYPENAGLNLQVDLRYNSRVTSLQNRGIAASLHRYHRIRRQNPFGLGFDVSVGRIIRYAKQDGDISPTATPSGRLSYVDSSGASHDLAFFQTTPSGDEWRTHDGSHIRAVWANQKWTVSFPNGVVQELGHFVGQLLRNPSIQTQNDLHWGDPAGPSSRDACDVTDGGSCELQYLVPDPDPNPTEARNGLDWNGFDRDYVGWHATKVHSRAATSPDPASYTVEYFGDDQNPEDLKFAHIIRYIRDQHNRTIEFVLDRANGTVSSIYAPAAPSTSGPRPSNQYVLEYKTHTLSIEGHTHKVRVLWRLWSPNVAEQGTQKYLHTFEYATSSGGNTGGQLSRVDYPSGKSTVIYYQRYPYQNGGPGICAPGPFTSTLDPDECNAATNGGTCAWSWGVERLETFLDGNPTNQAGDNRRVTTFSQTTTTRDYRVMTDGTCEAAPGNPYDHHGGYWRYDQVHTMVDPAGNKTEFVFRTPKNDGLTDASKRKAQSEYGLLMAERYYGGATGQNVRLLKEVTYVHKELDHYYWSAKEGDYEMAPETIATIWRDDEGATGGSLPDITFLREERSDFDDFGHHQRTEYWGPAIGPERVVLIRDYAADNKAYNGATCPTAATLQSNWLGEVLARQEVLKLVGETETLASRTVFGYDVDRGLRTRAVQRSSTTEPFNQCDNDPDALPGDIGTDYQYWDRGDLKSERRYLPLAGPESFPSDVTTEYTYEYGALQSAKNTGLGYYNFVRVIDPTSGLPREERSFPLSSTDTSVVTTRFAYDPIGRRTRVSHASDDPVIVTYENVAAGGNPTPPSPASRLARVRTIQGSNTTLTEAVDHFSKARFDHEETVTADGTRVYRYTTYDNADRVAFVSEWTSQTTSVGVPGTTTSYTVYDGTTPIFEEPFGRPTKTTNPIGGVSRFRYFGPNKEVTTESVALKANSLDDPASVSVQYYTDGLGRLRFVSSPRVSSPVQGHGPYEETGTAARYSYDVLGRLVQLDVSASGQITPVDGNRFAASAPSPQTRSFAYNFLGRLTSSTSPEAGTEYNDRWNALDAVTQSRDAEATARGYVLRTTYDVAGRPTKMSKVSASSTTNYLFTPASGGLFEKVAPGGWRWRVDSTGACLLGIPSWYIGNTSCQYAQSGIEIAEIESLGTLSGLGPDAILSFKYFREVHGDAPEASPRDVLRVQVRDTGASPSTWKDVYVLDSTQISWSKWMRSPAISLAPYLPSIGSLRLQFVFDSVVQNNEVNLRGIGITDVTIGQPDETILQETYYDEGLGVANNNSRGKPTRVLSYDESTRAPSFVRELHYATTAGRLSDDRLTFDWDRDGTPATLVSEYAYDRRGQLAWQRMPHPAGAPQREYNYALSHGFLERISVSELSGVRTILGDDWGVGIEYEHSGGMKLVHYANRLQQHFTRNAASMPTRIWVDRDGWGNPLFDTGAYVYDGASNIKQIGADYFRYDAASRLTWSRTISSLYGTVDLDQQYDPFGNMTAQTATFPNGSSPALPNGLVFNSRTYASSTNRITAPNGFVYDASGRLVVEPGHDGLLSQAYRYTSAGELTEVKDASGKWTQVSQHDGEGNRWFRSLWAEGGAALITLRDVTGRVVADFRESSSTSGLKLEREYVYANGQLVAINSMCGPRPALSLASDPVADGQVWFEKTDYVPAVGSYTIVIKDGWGQTNALYRPSNLSNHFGIPLSEFFEGQSNEIQIETDAECGHTGYSNAVVFGHLQAPSAPGCLTSVGVSRSGFNGTGSNLTVRADGDCGFGTTYNVHYQPWYNELEDITLNEGYPEIQPLVTVVNIPCDAGEGYYWASPVSGGEEGPPSLEIYAGPSTCGGGGGVSQPNSNLQFVHWDHLGSTRLVTDEQGAVIASSKYFPFGYEAESVGGGALRQKFTRQERDDRVGLDYMYARNYRPSLARFLEVDPIRIGANPQGSNRYAYAGSSPVSFVDRDGLLAVYFLGTEERIDGSPTPALVDVANGRDADAFIVAGPRAIQPGSMARRVALGQAAVDTRQRDTLEIVGFSRGAREAVWLSRRYESVDLLVAIDPELTSDHTVPASVKVAVNIADGIHYHGAPEESRMTAADSSKTTVANLRLVGPGIGAPGSATSHTDTASATKSFVRTLVRLSEFGMLNKTTLLQAIQEFNTKNQQGLRLMEEERKENGSSE